MDLQGYIKRMKAEQDVRSVPRTRRGRARPARCLERESFVAKDMVDVLLEIASDPNLEVQIDRDGIKAFIQDLIAGGTESSAMTVEWAMRSSRSPSGADVGTPSVPQGRVVDGYDIPVGTRVLVCVWSIARDPVLWDSPEEFMPERFLGSKIDVKGQDFELLPFGSGRRMCPGYNLGLKVIQVSLANLLHGFAWRLPDGMATEELSMEEIFGLSTPRKFPVEAVVDPKLAAHLYTEA
ncbi:hypothetical protein QYE76_025102 [Lolium multiflorum]|uniref:Uncharacterized protein n=1 Tax=Lolium multiflorum TaxID=4521 RepID=A0AAD8RF01_LOLMU|nr:hypothetical protein QYE76_025102 [Lolium multiflorum]